MLPWSAEFAGRIDEHVFSSELLRGNPLTATRDALLAAGVVPGVIEFELFEPPTPRSTTGTRGRWPGSASGWPTDPLWSALPGGALVDSLSRPAT